MKLQLIKAPTINTGMPEHNWYMPLNLIWLANYIKPYYPDIEILDGQLLNLNEILNRIDADVIGVSFDALSIDSFDAIIKEAKKRGIFTITGGHLPTALSEILIRNNPYLDAIITYDGEESLRSLLQTLEKKESLSKIPNLLWKSGEKIIKNPIKEVNLDCIPIPDRNIGGLNINHYIHNFQFTKDEQYLNFAYSRPTNTYSHKGCIFRQNGNGCSFCSRVDKRFRLRPADKIYSEYQLLQKKYEIDYISDFSDSWIYTPFLLELAEQYEIHGEINARLRVYGDIRLITDENVKLMSELGVDTVLLGIESGDERILKLNGKPVKRKEILSTIELLTKYNIRISDAYVLGLIGETVESLNNTLSLTQEIKSIANTEITYCNIMTPLPGNRIWDFMESKFEINDYKSLLSNFSLRTFEIEAISAYCKLGPNGYDIINEYRVIILNNSKIQSKEFVN